MWETSNLLERQNAELGVVVHVPILLGLRRLRQENVHEFEACLGENKSPCLKKKKKKKEEKFSL